MDDLNVITTGTVGSNENSKLSTVEGVSSQIMEQAINNETNIGLASSSAVCSEAAVSNEETRSVDDNPTPGLLLLQGLEPAGVINHAQPPSDSDIQAPVRSTDISAKASLLTTTVDNTGISEKSTENVHSRVTTSDVQLSASMASVNATDTTTTTTTATTIVTPLQTGKTDIGPDNTCRNASAVEEAMRVSSLSSATRNVTTIASASPSFVTHSASVANSSSTALSASAYSLPNTVKLQPSMPGKAKMKPQDFDIPFQKPITGASGYNSSKVAAEMAKIDSFLASLAKGGASSNPVPNMNKIKTETTAVSKPTPVGSALGNIALSYGYSEEESSSSSSDESEDDQPATTRSTKMTAADAVVAMDTQEVEQSMKKVAVSSDSSSSSSEDELG